MIDLILGNVWPYILAAGGVVAAFIGAYLRGRKEASDKAENRAASTYLETMKRARDEDYIDPNLNIIRDRLRDRGKR